MLPKVAMQHRQPNRRYWRLDIIVVFAVAISRAVSFSIRSSPSRSTRIWARHSRDSSVDTTRRQLSTGLWLPAAVLVAASSATTAPSYAADPSPPGDTIWLTGKAPRVPGQRPQDKNDTSGTRKDPRFLRSLADCKNQCERSAGPDGFAKTKEECLSECQDVCCMTYEQCTFAIVPRI